jgi:hypothetical protein
LNILLMQGWNRLVVPVGDHHVDSNGLSVGLDKGGRIGWIRDGVLRCILRLNGKGNKTD